MEKFADKNLKDFNRGVSFSENQPECGSIAALCGSLASSLGIASLSFSEECNSSSSETSCSGYLTNLETLRTYFLFLVDEDIKSRVPLDKSRSTDLSDPDNFDRYQASLRMACSIPTEIMYKTLECVDLLCKISEICAPSVLPSIGCSLLICSAVLKSTRLICLSNARSMRDRIYAKTVSREFEINFDSVQPRIDSVLSKIEEQFNP